MTDEEAEEFGTERIDLDGIDIDPEAIAAVPAAFARAYHFMPVARYGDQLHIAVPEADSDYVDDIMLGLGSIRELVIVGAYRDEIDRCIARYY